MVAKKYLPAFHPVPPFPQTVFFRKTKYIYCMVEARQTVSTHILTSWVHKHIGWAISMLIAPHQPQDILSLAGFIICWDIKEMGHKSIGNQAVSSGAHVIAFFFSGHQSSQLKSKMSRCLVTLCWACRWLRVAKKNIL